MKRLLPTLAVLISIMVLPVIAKDRPQRIVSIGLCTDQLLLLLADREQIASLSTWAVDENMSYMIDSVGDIPLNNSLVEDIVPFQPDLVVANQFAAWDSSKFLRQLGYEVRQIPLAESIRDIYLLLAQFGEWTGNRQRADEVIAKMKRDLDVIRERYRHRPEKSVIIYTPNGYSIGANTLEDDLYRHAGYRNLAAEMGISGFQPVSLEKIIAANPDVLQVDQNLSRQDSLATAVLRHPAIGKLAGNRENLDIPTRLRICAGPMIVEAVEQMAARR